jgi:hypothetical protein
MNDLTALNTVSEDLGRLSTLTTALECYADLLQKQDVQASSDVGQAISLGLESIDPTFDVKEGGMITLRAIKDGLIKAAKATRHAIKVLFELLSSIYVKFTGSISRVRSNYKWVSRRLGKLGNKVTYKKMEVAGINRLSINGAFVGDDVTVLQSIQQLSEYILNSYPRIITQVTRDCNREFMNIVDRQQADAANIDIARESVEAFAKALNRHFKEPSNTEPANMRELPSAFKDAGVFHRSEVVPGNYALVFTHPQQVMHRAERTQAVNYAQLINQAFTIRFVEMTLKTADRSTRVIDVPSVQVLSQLLSKISDILTIAEKGDVGRRDFDVVKATVDDTIRQVAERSNNVGNANNVILHMLGAMSTKLAEPMGNYTHWLAVTMNIYLTFIDHCIKHYNEEGV